MTLDGLLNQKGFLLALGSGFPVRFMFIWVVVWVICQEIVWHILLSVKTVIRLIKLYGLWIGNSWV